MLNTESQKFVDALKEQALEVLRAAGEPMSEAEIFAGLPALAGTPTPRERVRELWLHTAVRELFSEGAVVHADARCVRVAMA